jgi:hypothetical protein
LNAKTLRRLRPVVAGAALNAAKPAKLLHATQRSFVTVNPSFPRVVATAGVFAASQFFSTQPNADCQAAAVEPAALKVRVNAELNHDLRVLCVRAGCIYMCTRLLLVHKSLIC